jgi:hypothetical protein
MYSKEIFIFYFYIYVFIIYVHDLQRVMLQNKFIEKKSIMDTNFYSNTSLLMIIYSNAALFIK